MLQPKSMFLHEISGETEAQCKNNANMQQSSKPGTCSRIIVRHICGRHFSWKNLTFVYKPKKKKSHRYHWKSCCRSSCISSERRGRLTLEVKLKGKVVERQRGAAKENKSIRVLLYSCHAKGHTAHSQPALKTLFRINNSESIPSYMLREPGPSNFLYMFCILCDPEIA